MWARAHALKRVAWASATAGHWRLAQAIIDRAIERTGYDYDYVTNLHRAVLHACSILLRQNPIGTPPWNRKP